MSDSLQPHGLYSPWNSPGQNTVVGSHSLPQGIFPTQGSNPGLLLCRWILYQLSYQGSLLYGYTTIFSFIHSFTEGHLDSGTLNIHIQIVECLFSVLLGTYLGAKLLGHMVKSAASSYYLCMRVVISHILVNSPYSAPSFLIAIWWV